MVSPRDFISITREKVGGQMVPVGFDIRVGALLGTVFGGVVLAFFEGLIALPLGAAKAVSLLFDTISSGMAELIRKVVGPSGAFEVAWAAANAQVIASGVLGFVLAIAVVLATMYIVALGVDSLVE